MLKVIWRNRRQLPYAWRILRDGVCDGCALGTTGLHDFTMKGVHLCTVRLNLLPLNTMPAVDSRLLADCDSLAKKSSKELRALGRLAYPMRRRKGEKGFTRISWEEALELEASRIRATDPSRLAFFLTSRGVTNETYYVCQKAARFLGTNHVDNSARLCHAPSTTALKATLGEAASTCSYKDWIGADLIVFVGSNTSNNQPVTTKYLYYAKQQGTKIALINTYREPGMDRYWVPSVLESAVFGTKLTDEFFSVHTGGDIAFLNGVLKHLLANNWLDETFIRDNTSGFEALRQSLDGQSWEDLEKYSGTSRADMWRFADMYRQARTVIFVWSMGITHHTFGTDAVKAIVNVVLARGMVGKPHTGLVPIRGHSGVQAGAEVGCVPAGLPGNLPLNEGNCTGLEKVWNFPVPRTKGMNCLEMLQAADQGGLEVMHIAGGNFMETLPDPDSVRRSLEKVPLRVHQDLVLTSQMLVEPGEEVLILPARSRYEQVGGGTETSTERYVIYSPEIPGRRVGESRAEWEIFMQLAERVKPGQASLIHFADAASVRKEMALTVPDYAGIEHFKAKGDAVQWGGRLLFHDGKFKTADGKAHFSAVSSPELDLPAGRFMASTRRGRQFNSMIEQERDPLTGAWRQDVLMAQEDVRSLGLKDGAPILLKSEAGQYQGRVKTAAVKPRNLQVHWPEGNVLLKSGLCDAPSGVPDYNAVVEVIPQ
jgi:molybdopterin-dependent oxidoreductase alpha subunit